MSKNKTRIFTYLPSPRIWKALIAADKMYEVPEMKRNKR